MELTLCDVYTAAVARLIFPLQETLKGHDTVARRRHLEQSQWWSTSRILESQTERLRRFLEHSGARVPYYRDLFRKTGFDPRAVRSAADLQHLPLLTKSTIRANLERLKSETAGPLTRYNTGGSTGEPLIFYMGRDRVSHDVAGKWRASRWWNVDIGDPEIVVWGSPIELGAQDLMRALRDRVFRSRLLPAFDMSESNLDRFIAQIRAMRPRVVSGYPSALAHIARHAAAKGRRLDDLGIRVAISTAEALYEDQHRQIEAAYGCPVSNLYGGRDSGFIAQDCPQGGMHICAEDIVVEIVGTDGAPVPPGQAGEIVVTHLATGDFPFIRYPTGDVGVLDDRACPCGRGLPLIREIQGRTTDFVVARDGTIMHGLALVYVVRDLPGIARFKIVQESIDHTRVLLVVDPGFERGHVEGIRTGMAQRLGQDVRIDVEIVADIPAEASGKFRYVVSKAVVK